MTSPTVTGCSGAAIPTVSPTGSASSAATTKPNEVTLSLDTRAASERPSRVTAAYPVADVHASTAPASVRPSPPTTPPPAPTSRTSPTTATGSTTRSRVPTRSPRSRAAPTVTSTGARPRVSMVPTLTPTACTARK